MRHVRSERKKREYVVVLMMAIYPITQCCMRCVLHYGDRRSDQTPVIQPAANKLSWETTVLELCRLVLSCRFPLSI